MKKKIDYSHMEYQNRIGIFVEYLLKHDCDRGNTPLYFSKDLEKPFLYVGNNHALVRFPLKYYDYYFKPGHPRKPTFFDGICNLVLPFLDMENPLNPLSCKVGYNEKKGNYKAESCPESCLSIVAMARRMFDPKNVRYGNYERIPFNVTTLHENKNLASYWCDNPLAIFHEISSDKEYQGIEIPKYEYFNADLLKACEPLVDTKTMITMNYSFMFYNAKEDNNEVKAVIMPMRIYADDKGNNGIQEYLK